MNRPAVFIDRDGTLLTERGYLSDPKKIRFYDNCFRGLKLLQKNKFKLVVVTNQSGVGRGYFSLHTLDNIHKRFKSLCRQKGVNINGIYACPHHPSKNCPCRKPNLGLIRIAVKELNIDLQRSFMVGDQDKDILLAQNCGIPGILVMTGGGRQTKSKLKSSPIVTKNFYHAAKWIVRQGSF